MQELIEYVDEIWANVEIEQIIKEKAIQLLEKEKEQILDAIGVGSQFDRNYLYGYHAKAEEYYNQNYNQNK